MVAVNDPKAMHVAEPFGRVGLEADKKEEKKYDTDKVNRGRAREQKK